LFAMCPLLLEGCHSSRSDSSFDQIRSRVQGKTAEEVLTLLGPPDTRRSFPLGDEQWIWWDYTFLGGEDYAPEVRGKIVHLQITFGDPIFLREASSSQKKLQTVDPESVSFLYPAKIP
jgi:hypothetical protein